MNHDLNMLDEFVAEAGEHLDTVEGGLLDLENRAEDADQELIASIFRSIHSIKGAAGFLGLSRINELSHIMETLLDMMRSGQIAPESQYIDGLFAGLDHLRTMVDDVSGSNNMDIQAVHDRISSLIGRASSPLVRKEMATQINLADSRGDDLALEISEFQLNKLLPEHKDLFLLKFDLAELGREGGPTPVALVRELLSTGEIVEARLDTPADSLDVDLAATPLYYNVLYATILERHLIHVTTGLPEERIIEVERPQLNARPDDQDATDTADSPAKADHRPAKDTEGSKKDSARNLEKNSRSAETVRIHVDILDKLMALAGELVLVRNQHLMSVDTNDPVVRGISQRLDVVTSELQENIMRTRMQPIGTVFGKISRIVRDLSRKLAKEIDISISGNEVELDKTILEALADPLTHLIRNCCDHGIESPEQRRQAGKPASGLITVEAFHEAGLINILISDNGRGIHPDVIRDLALKKGLKTEQELSAMGDKELISLILLPGFSTASQVSDVSGRGVGMDVVKTAIERFGGSLDLDSTAGSGTTIHLRLPLTLAIIPCLIVLVGEHRYAIPQVNLEELVCLYEDEDGIKIESTGDQEVYRLRDSLLPMVRLNEVLARPEPFTRETKAEITGRYTRHDGKAAEDGTGRDSLTFVVVRAGEARFGLIVDRVQGTEEIVVKPMHPAVKKLNTYSGATVMGDGQVALILDIEGVAQHAALESIAAQRQEKNGATVSGSANDLQSVLLFKNGEQEQFAIPLQLIKRIESVKTSAIERIGDTEFITIDGVSTRILRLDGLLNVSPTPPEQEEVFLLLPKHVNRPFGILISRLLDVVEVDIALDETSYMEDGILGTAIVKDFMTLFLDIYRLIELADPDYQATMRQSFASSNGSSTILLVEDTPFFQKLIRQYLQAADYRVQVAHHGAEGLEMLAKGDFSLIVSDLEMPVMDGWEFMSQVRRDPRFKEIPAIALTALTSEKDRERAVKAGFDAYEVKIDRNKLLVEVQKILRAKEAVAA